MTSEHTVTPDEHPTRIGPYIVLELIGSGGMGNVYLGRHADTSRFAAVKVLPPTMARVEGFRLRFSREIEALERLSNPHIVQLLDSGEDEGTYYYAMEYVAGETLSHRLKRERRLAWRDAVAIAQQLCAALRAAHDAGVIHRDLKPSNVLLGNDGVVKLTDFGIAQLFAADKLTLTGGVVGTAEYMSPEQAQGQRATKRSDLYSLGAVLYVMLTGRPPFVGPTAVDIMQKQRFGQFDLPGKYVPEIPTWLDTVVASLLEKEPDRRIADAYVLSKRLQEVVQKVERATSEQSTTVDVEPTGDAASQTPEGPGEATLMRDLIRVEIAREQAGTPVQQLFNNTWVLLTLLALLVGGVWWGLNRRPSAALQFAAGERLMEADPGPEWLQARDDYFQPLLAADPETWRDKVTPYLDEIAVYELERTLLHPRSDRRRKQEPTEFERQLRDARRLWDDGQWDAAAARLAAIEQLTAGDPDLATVHRLAAKWRAVLAEQLEKGADPSPTIQAALDRAAANPAQAHELLQAVVTLYENDARATKLVAEAKRRLAERNR
jgi:serine/threonine protein kinase